MILGDEGGLLARGIVPFDLVLLHLLPGIRRNQESIPVADLKTIIDSEVRFSLQDRIVDVVRLFQDELFAIGDTVFLEGLREFSCLFSSSVRQDEEDTPFPQSVSKPLNEPFFQELGESHMGARSEKCDEIGSCQRAFC